MTIETKYNVGEVVWFMHNNEARFSKIANWQISGNNGRTPIIIYFLELTNDITRKEHLLFATKEELINSL